MEVDVVGGAGRERVVGGADERGVVEVERLGGLDAEEVVGGWEKTPEVEYMTLGDDEEEQVGRRRRWSGREECGRWSEQ